jgi:hypothetical protein
MTLCCREYCPHTPRKGIGLPERRGLASHSARSKRRIRARYRRRKARCGRTQAFSKRIGRNESFNHAGNARAAMTAGVVATSETDRRILPAWRHGARKPRECAGDTGQRHRL